MALFALLCSPTGHTRINENLAMPLATQLAKPSFSPSKVDGQFSPNHQPVVLSFF
jgi:hypothetical protein